MSELATFMAEMQAQTTSRLVAVTIKPSKSRARCLRCEGAGLIHVGIFPFRCRVCGGTGEGR